MESDAVKAAQAKLAEAADMPAEWVEIERLKPWPGNPRKHDPTRLVALIKRFGFTVPIVARKANGEIIAGHKRRLAALALGLKRVPVRWMDVTEDDAHQMALSDNRETELTEYDDGLLENALASYDEATQAIIGFDQSDDIGDEEELTIVDDMDPATTRRPVGDMKFFVAIEGPLLRQPDALDRLKAHLEELPDCIVSVHVS